MLRKRTATTSKVPISEAGKGRSISWFLNVTFGGKECGGGKVEDETSKPVNWHVGGKLLATSKSQIPVPVPISAILMLGDINGMLG